MLTTRYSSTSSTSFTPDVNVEFISGSLGELTARVDAEKENPQADIIFGGLSQTDGDQYIDLLQEYTPKYADDCAVESTATTPTSPISTSASSRTPNCSPSWALM